MNRATIKPLWMPTEKRVRASQMHAFMERISRKYGVAADYVSLHAWSIRERAAFWAEMFAFAEIRTTAPAAAVESGSGMLGTKWFPGLEFNFAAHLLRFDDDRIAIQAEDELGRARTFTYRQLRREVARCAAALRAVGVKRGDRVAGFLPNIPEAVIAMLAAASLGAIWSSCSPDFGVSGVIDRFGQIEPKVLFAADGYSYNGKPIDSLPRIHDIVERIPSIAATVVAPFLDAPRAGQRIERRSDTPLPPRERGRGEGSSDAPSVSDVRGRAAWNEFLARGDGQPLRFEPTPFDHPLYIMYSSGTTGVPKCIVHGAGGTLLQHMKELMLHTDLRRDDLILYFTTCGWMMWNWLVSSLGVGATVVLYEGAPFHPAPDHLWRMTERLGITVFGTSAKYIAACEKVGLHPGKDHNLSKLRAVLSTGSPLAVENFEWIYREVKNDLQLASICGGTDIISCFILGNPMLSVYAGEIQSIGLGMDVRAFDERGQSVIGSKGELVCCSPFPSQPVGFWKDPDGAKYRKAYFEQYPGIWRHGDFVEITEHGGVIVYGRSDATLNPGGVRIGTAEIYRQVETLEEIVDSIVVGKNTPDADIEVCLFVVLRPNVKLDDALLAKIRARIAEGATKRHVPKHIRQVSAVPYTISGKKVELAVQQTIHGQPVPNRDALANPEVLAQFADIL